MRLRVEHMRGQTQQSVHEEETQSYVGARYLYQSQWFKQLTRNMQPEDRITITLIGDPPESD